MRETARHEYLLAAPRGKCRADPAAVAGRARTQIDRHVVDAAAQYAYELGLDFRRHLKVQRAHSAALERQGLIVLHELGYESRITGGARVISLDEIASGVGEIARYEQQHARDFCGFDLHVRNASPRARRRMTQQERGGDIPYRVVPIKRNPGFGEWRARRDSNS